MASTDAADIAALIDRLTALADARDREQLVALTDRLAARRFRILVVGEAKRGKSTLVNALLRRMLLPTGVTPVTALPTVVRHGDHEGLQVTYLDGRAENRPITELAELVSEDRNPDNRLRVAEVVVHTPAGLHDGVDLVDTPGVGSVFAHSAAAAVAALDTMDAAVFVLSADPPVSGSERAFLAEVRGRSVALFCVLNKVDNLCDQERAEVLDFTAGVVSAALGSAVRVYPVSARQALSPHRPAEARSDDGHGVTALHVDLLSYLSHRRSGDLVASVAGHAARVAARLLDAAVLTRRAAQLSAAEAGEQVDRFTAQLDALDEHRRDSADVARASIARLLADLNDAATWDTPRLTSQLRDLLTSYLDAQPGMPASAREDQARAYAVQQLQSMVDAWRQQREQVIADGLAAVDARLAAALERQIQGVRQAAHDLLGVELAIPVPAAGLLPEVGVSYAFGEAIGTTVQWEAALRRHLPGRWGRRAVAAHLLDELDTLVGKQIGRIRSALQNALRPASSALIRAVDSRYSDAVAGLLAALAAARDLAQAPDREPAMRQLDVRVADLHELTGALEALRGQHHLPQVAAGGV